MINTLSNTPNQITTYLHCGTCLRDGQSPQLEVGITNNNEIQVWCKRHQLNVALFTSLTDLPHGCDACQSDEHHTD